MKTFKINNNDAGQRLDKFVQKSTSALPTSLLYKYIRQKRIKVNSKRAEISLKLCEGDIVDMYIPEEFFAPADDSYKSLKPHLDIVYEDENILIVNKPCGMSCHPDEEQTTATLIDFIKAYLFRSGAYVPDSEASFAPALCNRIDRNTCGIVICAKNSAALRELNRLIKERRVVKKYLALIHGKPKSNHMTLTHYLKKNASEKLVKVYTTPDSGGLIAITELFLLRYDKEKDISLLELILHTGRTHQLRAQLGFVGLPMVGDGKYGINREDARAGYDHQALCAYYLKLLPEQGDLLYYLGGREFTVVADDRFTM
ncbi:MAG: RluA family pseudouridine synthase [Oscillospiraceae bacterium]|nr:RluA family pseudouridine synthase [Oscillospiraceae bacterium]